MRHAYTGCIATFVTLLLVDAAWAQSFSSSITGSYEVDANATYLKVGAWEGKLDVYSRSDAPGPHPTLIYFHGGGPIGVASRKEFVVLDLVPYLERGWNVVNVEYDLPGHTLAPIAVQNAVCAVHYIGENAAKYRVDLSRIYTSGYSSGGWVALMSAMAPANSLWDKACPSNLDTRVAAVVNWSGTTDFADLLEGPEAKPWAAYWFRTLPNPVEVGKSVSPVTLVRPSVPAVISIHGDADPTVPYSQATKLHARLKQAGVKEMLLTVNGGGHGGYSREQSEKLFAAIARFLAEVSQPPK
jgi:acetyl esterase/lipase